MLARTVHAFAPHRRYAIFALVASLIILTAAATASAQEPDRDGDAYPDSSDTCPDQPYNGYPGGGYGCPGAEPPDSDGDGVADNSDACPGEGASTAGVDASGCPIPDGDGDGWGDDDDGCPDKPADENYRWPNGCPGHVKLEETPPASGPSCTKKMPCIVLERKGLSEKQHGGYLDPNATVKVTIARDARGVPARVVGVQLRNVNSSCTKFGSHVNDRTHSPGPEVSADLDAFALTKKRVRHANFFSNAFMFDPRQAVRTIAGQQYEVSFYMEEDGDAREAELSINFADDWNADHCSINIYGNNDPVTDGVCTGNADDAESGACSVAESQYLDHVYEHGQALYLDCGVSFKCPAAKNVDVKVTVIKPVAKALGLKSRTISRGKTVGPKRTKLDGEKGTYYFARLRDDVLRKMKAKKVNSITVTVSGTADGPDGTRRFTPTRTEWYVNGNCSGRDLKIKKHLTYGGECSRR